MPRRGLGLQRSTEPGPEFLELDADVSLLVLTHVLLQLVQEGVVSAGTPFEIRFAHTGHRIQVIAPAARKIKGEREE